MEQVIFTCLTPGGSCEWFHLKDAASQRGSDQRQPLVPYVGTARHAAEEDVIVDQFLQAQVLGEGGSFGPTPPCCSTGA